LIATHDKGKINQLIRGATSLAPSKRVRKILEKKAMTRSAAALAKNWDSVKAELEKGPAVSKLREIISREPGVAHFVVVSDGQARGFSGFTKESGLATVIPLYLHSELRGSKASVQLLE
jgi:hypothetical protein